MTHFNREGQRPKPRWFPYPPSRRGTIPCPVQVFQAGEIVASG